jgi:hypothetical protein
MNNSCVTLLLFLIIIVIVIVTVRFKVGYHEMVYVKSDIDNDTYMVRNKKDKKLAANLLARVKSNIHSVTKYLFDKLNKNPNNRVYKEFKPYIIQLNDRIKNVIVKESSENSVHTSYTVYKGEQIVFCIRSKAITHVLTSNNIHDINLVMYVALHEMSHVACPEYHHTPLFKKIFKFICEEAIEMGIYKKIDFKNYPKEYCGMWINESIV